jgi:hypothetical protein|tara:strand:- start:243 stop:512 length:270 start_codon:yes stop_codon:yes gene_type:complete
MANRYFNKQVSPKKYMVGGRVKRDRGTPKGGELGEIKEQRLAAGNGKDTPDKPRDKRPPMKAEKLRVQKEKMADKFRLKERKLRGLKND